MKLKRMVSVFLMLTLLCVTGCSGGGESSEDNLLGHEISLCMRTPDTLNPILTVQSSCARVYDLIYDSLVYVDKELRPVSALAEKCSISDDGKTIKFTLHEGILWHDGKAFTAYDVQYTFNQIMNSEDSMYKSRLDDVEEITVVDINHFNISLSEPNVNILNLLDFPIIPVHNSEPEKTPIGTGMYKFIEMVGQDSIVLERNDSWMLGDRPEFKRINIKLIDSDDDIFSLVNLGEVSAAVTDVDHVGGIGADSKVLSVMVPTLKYEFLGLNFDNGALCSQRVRQAISYAVNRDEISSGAYYGYSSPANAPVPGTSWLYDADYNRFGYDPEMATECLTGAGYSLSDGVYKKTTEEGGIISLDFTILVNEDNAFRIKSGEIICKQLAAAGMQATLLKLPFDEYIERIQNGEYSMFLGGYDLSADLDFRFMLSTDGIESGTNVFNYSSIDMDRATSALCTPTSDDGIKKAYSNFQMVFSRDVPIVGIGFVNDVFFHSDSIDVGEGFASYKVYREINSWKLK